MAPKKSKSVLISDFDKYLIGQGTHERTYEKLGAHLTELDGKQGVHFAVWAPNARQVSIVGDFNDWQPDRHTMMPSDSGIWTAFIPELGEYTVYKYHIVPQSGDGFDKADPYGFGMEQRPKTASVVINLDRYQWGDSDWVSNRSQYQAFDKPIAIYEVHLGSWRRQADEQWGIRYLTYREFADQLIPYVLEMGYTHIELMPVAEYPFDASWGYQVLGFFAPTSRFGTPEDFMYFVDKCHQNKIGVILDWVPAHFPKDGAGLNYFDGTHLYSHSDPRKGEHQDWGTLIFNYDRHEVRSFLISNALFWIDKYHIDGLRVDAVASMLYLDYSREEGQWVPNEYGGRENLGAISFLRSMNETVHVNFPGVLTVAEEIDGLADGFSSALHGRFGLQLKVEHGLDARYLKLHGKKSIHRKYHHNDLTFSLLYAFNENFVLPLSHDEVVHGKGSIINKMAGDEWQKFANLRAFYGYLWGHPGKKLLFMGNEFAQWQEWDYDTALEWTALSAPNHQGIQVFVKDLNRTYKNEPAMYEDDFEYTGFQWIDANDSDNSVFSFIRFAKSSEDFVVIVSNFTPVVRQGYRIGVHKPGFYREILNSNSSHYWGSNVGNGGGVHTEDLACHGREYSLLLTLPPLSTIWLKLPT